MLSDFYRPGVALDFPKGGTQAIVAALVRGVTKHEGCALHLNCHVAKVRLRHKCTYRALHERAKYVECK